MEGIVIDGKRETKDALVTLVAEIEWRHAPKMLDDGDCHFCHSNRRNWVDSWPDSPDAIRIEAGQHDPQCPYPRLRDLVTAICAPAGHTITR